jgi:hypothetical protein
MLRALALAALLLAGCAAPAPTHTASPPAATASATGTGTAAATPQPKAPPLPPPQVGACDLTVTSAGTTNGAVRSAGCALSAAIPTLSKDARSLLVEVTWDSLPPTALQLKSTVENFNACPPPPTLPDACAELATNASMAPPVRLVVEGEAFAKYGAGVTAFENVYAGAAVQQAFHLTFSALPQERVPANYTALK